MRCAACNDLLTDYEATRKSLVTGDYLDLCTKCINLGDPSELAYAEEENDVELDGY